MLDRNSELAIPDESYFVPQLARQARDRRSTSTLRRRPAPHPDAARLGLSAEDVRERLRPGHAARRGDRARSTRRTPPARGKERWGDKTPMYMQHLPLLERLLPDARLRPSDPRRPGRCGVVPRHARGDRHEDVGASHDAAGFACQWRTEVTAAQGLGRRVGPGRYLEVRYEALVADPDAELERICDFAGPSRSSPGCSTTRAHVDVSREAAPAEPHAAAHAGPARLAQRDEPPRTWPRSRRSPATCSPSSATSSTDGRRHPAARRQRQA